MFGNNGAIRGMFIEEDDISANSATDAMSTSRLLKPTQSIMNGNILCDERCMVIREFGISPAADY